MQSIVTKFLGPTNTRGARIKATSESGESLTISYDYSARSADLHASAAEKLARKLAWGGKWIGGGIKGGYVFVCANKFNDCGFSAD